MDTLNLNVKSAIEALMKSENFESSSKVDITAGSQSGDGYTSKTISVTITGKDKKLDLFIKSFPEDNRNPLLDLYYLIYSTELKFYNEIYPAILKFQQEKGTQDIFDNVPKYYRAENAAGSIPPIILGNLRPLGYVLRDGREQISDSHITAALKAYAKLHATSFAMRDQKPELFAQLCGEIQDFFGLHFDTFGISDCIMSCMKAFVQSLDPEIHGDIYDTFVNLPEDLLDFSRNLHKKTDDYVVLCHGDCWSNNFMYASDVDKAGDSDIKLLDWQMIRCNSPTIDLVYFFYGVARKETIDNFDRYMNLYYDTLSDHVTSLGSDPHKVYPREIFMNHLKKFAKYGLTMAFGINRNFLLSEEEIPNIIGSRDGKVPIFPIRFKLEDIYRERMINLLKHFIEKEFI